MVDANAAPEVINIANNRAVGEIFQLIDQSLAALAKQAEIEEVQKLAKDAGLRLQLQQKAKEREQRKMAKQAYDIQTRRQPPYAPCNYIYNIIHAQL